MTNAIIALKTVIDLLEVASTLTFHATQLQKLLATAQAEGRDLTPAELASAQALDDNARKSLAQAIIDKRLALPQVVEVGPAPGVPGTRAWEESPSPAQG